MDKIDPRDLKFRLQCVDRHSFSLTSLLGKVNSSVYSDTLYQRNQKNSGIKITGGDSVSFSCDEILDDSASKKMSHIFVSGVSPFYQIDFDILNYVDGKIEVTINYPDTKINVGIKNNSSNGGGYNLYVEELGKESIYESFDLGNIEKKEYPCHFRLLVCGSNKLVAYVICREMKLEPICITLKNTNFYKKNYIDNQLGQIFLGVSFSNSRRIEISEIAVSQSCGVGQADPRVLHYEDGSPFIENGRVFVAMTTRGFEDIQNIYSVNLNGQDWKLEGQLLFDIGTDDSYHNFTAADIMYNRIDSKWYVFPISHNRDHQIYYGTSENDIKYGVNIIKVKLLDYPNSGDDEDFYPIFDSNLNKWRAVYCKSSKEGGYYLNLAEADSIDTNWKIIHTKMNTSYTGPIIQKIGNVYYVFSGRGIDTLEILDYHSLEKIGEVDYDGKTTSRNIWPVIFPVESGNQLVYSMLTFDRIAPLGGWSYGGLYFYKSQIFMKTIINNEVDRN